MSDYIILQRFEDDNDKTHNLYRIDVRLLFELYNVPKFFFKMFRQLSYVSLNNEDYNKIINNYLKGFKKPFSKPLLNQYLKNNVDIHYREKYACLCYYFNSKHLLVEINNLTGECEHDFNLYLKSRTIKIAILKSQQNGL